MTDPGRIWAGYWNHLALTLTNVRTTAGMSWRSAPTTATTQGTRVTLHPIPVSPEWRREWRGHGGGLLTVAALAGAGYITACQTFIVLQNGKLTHPSWWSWPFWVFLFFAAVGFYIVLATYQDSLFMPGRERPIDHSTKYSLWGSRTRPQVLTWASTRLARIR
jgi:hypothetical protein